MSKKIYLGESLSTLAVLIKDRHYQDVVVDLWSGGSLLSGIEICGITFDRVPMLIRNPPTSLGTEFISVKPVTTFVGSESSYDVKVSKNTYVQRNWLLELSSGGKIPSKFFCGMYRELRARVGSRRIYDTISKVRLIDKKLNLLRHGTMDYDILVNSLPIPYITGKVDLNVDIKVMSSKLDYVSLLIGVVLGEYKVSEYTVMYIGKTNFIPHTVVLIPLERFSSELPSNYALIYSITSIKRPYSSYKGEYVNRLLGDLRRLGLQDLKLLCYKLICEKYGLLGDVGPELEWVISSLRDYDVKSIGRLGTWREIGLDEILNNVSI